MRGDTGRNRQTGAIAIIVGLSIFVLIGFAGLVLDLGRLYVNKTELQNAADACALAAARDLTCANASCTKKDLETAQTTGIFVASRNHRDFQANAITIAPSDVTFSTTLIGSYGSTTSADPASKFVKCTSRATGIAPWFMQVLGFGAQNVSAMAVATLDSTEQNNCAIPLALCSKGSSSTTPPYNLIVGNWYTGRYSSGSGATGNYNWVDFTPPSGGASELAPLLAGNGWCNLNTTNPVGEAGVKQSLAQAFNTRFGLYDNKYSIDTAAPDYTGYAYTTKSWTAGSNALADFLTKRASRTPYQGDAASGVDAKPKTIADSSGLATRGADRRLVTAPIVDCAEWAKGSTTAKIQAWGCVLLLKPMGSTTEETSFEYRGLSSATNSPCATSGSGGGSGSTGPMVPKLVQ